MRRLRDTEMQLAKTQEALVDTRHELSKTKAAGQEGWILALARVCESPRCQIEPNKECVRKRLKPSIGSYRRWQSDWHTRALKGCSECCVPKSALSPANTCFRVMPRDHELAHLTCYMHQHMPP